MRSDIEAFLDRHGLNPEKIDMDQLCSDFIEQMHRGLKGQDSILPMIPSFCSPYAYPKAGQSVIVIDAGGTNLRTCMVTFDDNLNPVISDFKKSRMPGFDREVSAAEFFSILADETQRLIDKSDRIGFCFSYAAQITSDHDGIPLMFSKEIKAPQVIGKRLGVELLSEFARRGVDVSSKKIIILNDTVTTLLAAQASNTQGHYESCIGFILGTGTNTAYVEKNSNITKLSQPESCGAQIINVESGNFSICLGDLDKEFFDTTKEPENYRFEKSISGAYLGPLAYHVIKAACKEGLFSKEFCNNFAKLETLSTIEMSSYLEDVGIWQEPTTFDESQSVLGKCVNGNDDDDDTLGEILTSFIARAAKLTAVNLAAAVLVTDFGKDFDHPVLINADGTTFYKTSYLKAFTQEYLEAFLFEKGRKVEFTKIEDSPTIGSAIGALSL